SVWIRKLLEEAQVKSVKESFLVALHELYLTTDKGLNGSGFELELCLPDDESDLVERATMLGQLCEGVLYGLGLIGRLQDAEQQIPADVRELLGDFGDIARIDIDGLAEAKELGDADEDDLMQLIEFVRIGILTLNEELNPTQSAPIMADENAYSDTIH
ncbi:MAG: UPF0149 family protein, partial [Gammaproteobacteria bacterium]|nr:UPF0149 family protein [Gammaproteobacteria bacterium]